MPMVSPIVGPIVNPIVGAILGVVGPSFIRPLISNLGADATFVRSSTAYVKDFEGIYREVLSGESRHTGARRVHNLLSYSEDLSNAAWTKVSNGTGTAPSQISGNTYRFVTGGVASSDRSYFRQIYTGGHVVGQVYTKRLLVSASEATIIHVTDTAHNGSTADVAVDTTPKIISITYIGDLASDPRFEMGLWGDVAGDVDLEMTITEMQFEYVDGQSNQAPGEYVSNDVLSFPFHGANVDGVKNFPYENGNSVTDNVVTEAAGDAIPAATMKGYLSEGQRTNSILQSRDFDTTWSPTGTPILTQDQIGIDGVSNKAWTLEDDGVLLESIHQNVTIPNDSNIHCSSFYVLKDTDTTRFPEFQLLLTGGTTQQINTQINTQTGAKNDRISTGTVSSLVIDDDDWWRVVLIVANNASGNVTGRKRIWPAATTTLGIIEVATTGSIVIDQAQLELNTSFPSTPIPTTTAAVTRAADNLNYAIGSWFNHDGPGTFIAEGYVPFVGNSHAALYSIDDDSSSDRYGVARTSGVNTRYEVVDGGAVQVSIQASSDWVNRQTMKTGVTWDLNDFVLYRDGIEIGTDNAGTLPSGIIELKVGMSYNDTWPWFGNIKNLKYYKTRRPNEELVELTT